MGVAVLNAGEHRASCAAKLWLGVDATVALLLGCPTRCGAGIPAAPAGHHTRRRTRCVNACLNVLRLGARRASKARALLNTAVAKASTTPAGRATRPPSTPLRHHAVDCARMHTAGCYLPQLWAALATSNCWHLQVALAILSTTAARVSARAPVTKSRHFAVHGAHIRLADARFVECRAGVAAIGRVCRYAARASLVATSARDSTRAPRGEFRDLAVQRARAVGARQLLVQVGAWLTAAACCVHRRPRSGLHAGIAAVRA